jgi:hypothetical protein
MTEAKQELAMLLVESTPIQESKRALHTLSEEPLDMQLLLAVEHLSEHDEASEEQTLSFERLKS